MLKQKLFRNVIVSCDEMDETLESLTDARWAENKMLLKIIICLLDSTNAVAIYRTNIVPSTIRKLVSNLSLTHKRHIYPTTKFMKNSKVSLLLQVNHAICD